MYERYTVDNNGMLPCKVQCRRIVAIPMLQPGQFPFTARNGKVYGTVHLEIYSDYNG
jgi:hypothetical protein